MGKRTHGTERFEATLPWITPDPKSFEVKSSKPLLEVQTLPIKCAPDDGNTQDKKSPDDGDRLG